MGMNPRRGGLFALAALSATALAVPATAASAAPAPTPARQNVPTDVRLVDGDYKGGAPLPFTATAAAKLGAAPDARGRSTLSSPQADSDGSDLQVGEQKDWLSLIDGGVTPDGEEVTGGIDVRGYTLRGLGDHIEVWVADDLSFPDGDCRNVLDDGALTQVTDEQAQTFADEFDENVLPKESEAFSVAPDRDGTKGVMGEVFPDAGYPRTTGWARATAPSRSSTTSATRTTTTRRTSTVARTSPGSSSRRSTSSSTATS